MFCEFCGTTGPRDCAVCRSMAADLGEPVAERKPEPEPEPERIGPAATAALFCLGYLIGAMLVG